MATFAETDLRDALAFSGDLEEADDLPELRRLIPQGLRRLIPATYAYCSEVDLADGRAVSVTDPSGLLPEENTEGIGRFARELPVARFHVRTRGRAVMLSELLSPGQLHRTGVYERFYRRLGVEDQLAAALQLPGLYVGVGLGRDSLGFSERDRLLLDLLRPQMAAAYRRAASRTQARRLVDLLDDAAAQGGRGVVQLDGSGRVEHVSPGAAEWLREYLGWTGGSGLPPLLAGPVLTGAASAVFRHDGRRLAVRAVAPHALLLEEAGDRVSPSALAGLGLSPREAEVLAAMAAGLRNREIAGELVVSVGTVRKHVEHILAKLGVDSRGAAVATALGHDRGSPPGRARADQRTTRAASESAT